MNFGVVGIKISWITESIVLNCNGGQKSRLKFSWFDKNP